MNNELNKEDYMDMSHDAFVACMRYALSAANYDGVTVTSDFFNEIITRMNSLKGDLDDANDKLDRLERAKDIDDADYDHFDFDEVKVRANDMQDHAAALNEKEQAKEVELNRFLRQLERDAEEIGGDTGARINEAVGLIEAIRRDPYGGSDSLAIANEERLENKWNSSPF